MTAPNATISRLEVQDWDCPPAPDSCARPMLVKGFPFPYISDYHGISVSGSAGLVGALLVGMSYGKALAYSRDIALLGIHHMEGHLFAAALEHVAAALAELVVVAVDLAGALGGQDHERGDLGDGARFRCESWFPGAAFRPRVGAARAGARPVT